jgi:carbon starvation protein
VARHGDDDAGWQKIFSPDIKLGFLSHAHLIESQLATGALPAAIKTVGDAHRVIFNDYLDAGVAAFFMISVIVILADSIREWSAVLGGRKPVCRPRCRSMARFRSRRLKPVAAAVHTA